MSPASFDDDITFDFAGGPAVLDTVTQDSHIELRGPIQNAKGLIKQGKGARAHLCSEEVGITGAVRIDGGWLVLRDQSALPGTTGVTITGIRDEPTMLAMEGDGSHDRLPDAGPITVSDGAGIVLRGSNEKPVSENLGRITVRDNALQLEVIGKSAEAPCTLTVSELVRDPSSVIMVGGEKFGSAGFLKVQRDAAILAALKGGGGQANSTTISILPWARGLGGGHLSGACGLVTYDRATGFRELLPETEYVEGLHAATHRTDNVRVTATEPPQGQSKTIKPPTAGFTKPLPAIAETLSSLPATTQRHDGGAGRHCQE